MKNYWKPTPKRYRKIGDALLAASTFITASAIAMEHPTVAYIALAVGVVGKFLSNMFSDGKDN